jgi:ABC-type nitrate/sulfonate/bicarbonate transport system permease component
MDRILIAVGPIALIALWHFVHAVGLANPILVPSPSATFLDGMRLLASSALWHDFGATISRTLAGLFISCLLGIALGLAIGAVRGLHLLTTIPVDFLRSIPATALFPLAILLFGIGDSAKVAVVVYATTLVMVVQTYFGARAAATPRRQLMKLVSASLFARVRHLYFWEALPYILAGVRLSASLALIIIIVSEMFIGTRFGLGRRIIDAQAAYRVEELYATIIFVGIIGYLLNFGLSTMTGRMARWTGTQGPGRK